VVELLEKNPTLSIELGGHTDNVGKPEANQKLSEQRAKAVMVYLTNKGIEPSRLSYKGYGESQPVAPNDTEEGRATNRRTEIKIL
jgi:outer membrane protein OmpA-like peptidoglycan-associated protein